MGGHAVCRHNPNLQPTAIELNKSFISGLVQEYDGKHSTWIELNNSWPVSFHINQHLNIRMSKRRSQVLFGRAEVKLSPLGGLGLVLVELGDAAAVGWLGFRGLLRA